jgi:hypothetical protein
MPVSEAIGTETLHYGHQVQCLALSGRLAQKRRTAQATAVSRGSAVLTVPDINAAGLKVIGAIDRLDENITPA